MSLQLPKIPAGYSSSEFKGTVGTAVLAVVALLQSPVIDVQVAAIWCLAIVVGSYNLARGIAKLGNK